MKNFGHQEMKSDGKKGLSGRGFKKRSVPTAKSVCSNQEGSLEIINAQGEGGKIGGGVVPLQQFGKTRISCVMILRPTNI